MGEDSVVSESADLNSTSTLPIQHIYKDESGNICAVVLDSSNITYVPMVPVEATEEVVLFDGNEHEVKVEVDVNSGETYAVVYQGPKEDATSQTTKSNNGKQSRRGQHICKFCNKSFSQAVNLTTHERIHTGEKPYVCSVCLKPFSQQPNLWKHMRTHTGERPYQCNTCKKCFTQQANLAKHIRIHTGERPFICHYCNKRFTQQANLTKHVRLHTGERPFHCRHCSKTFVQQSNLERHERTHTGIKPFKCKFCCDSFAQNAHLNKHMRTVHRSVSDSVKSVYIRVRSDEGAEIIMAESVDNNIDTNSVNENESDKQDISKKIGIPVLYCTKTGRIIKRVD